MTLTPLCFSTNSTFMLLPKPKLQWRSEEEEEDFESLMMLLFNGRSLRSN